MRIEDLVVTPLPREIEGCHLSPRAKRFIRAVHRFQRARYVRTKRRYRNEALFAWFHLNGGDLGKLRNLGVRV